MVTPVVITLLVSIILGTLIGGRLQSIASLRITAIPLSFAALAYMVAGPFIKLNGVSHRLALASAYLTMAVFLVLNFKRNTGGIRLGIAIVALGWVLNATVIVANGGMPLSLHAYALSGHRGAPTPGEGGFFKIVLADDHSVLRRLGDVIPIRPLRQVLSVGDLVLLAGMGLVVVNAMKTQPENAASGKAPGVTAA